MKVYEVRKIVVSSCNRLPAAEITNKEPPTIAGIGKVLKGELEQPLLVIHW